MKEYDLDQLRTPWKIVGKATDALAAELHRECSEEHVLFGKDVLAIARREDCDDVLFAFGERFAVVHLTFSRHREEAPFWPATEIYDSWEQFIREGMQSA